MVKTAIIDLDESLAQDASLAAILNWRDERGVVLGLEWHDQPDTTSRGRRLYFGVYDFVMLHACSG